MTISAPSLATGLIRGWVRIYTIGLRDDERDSRRAEIESDLWEQQNADDPAGPSRIATAAHMVARWALGAPADVLWSLERSSDARQAANSDKGRKNMTAIPQTDGSAGAAILATTGRVLSVVIEPQSYLNVVYVLLAFPLSIAYFVILTTGLSAGLSLVIVWIGVPILFLTFAISAAFGWLERFLAQYLLRVEISPRPSEAKSAGEIPAESGLGDSERLLIRALRGFKARVSDRTVWTGLLYLFLKFPIGIVSFVVAIFLLSITLACLAAPFLYQLDGGLSIGIGMGEIWEIDTLGEALLLSAAGIPLLIISLHILNGLAFVSGRIAKVMLGRLG